MSPARMKSSSLAGSDLVAAARAWVGVPFRHQGRTRAGVDCAGLFVAVARELGIDVPFDRTDYPWEPDEALHRTLEGHFERVQARRPGDILLLHFGGAPRHMALWTGGSIIHAYAPLDKVVEHRIDRRWERRIVAAYRVPGVSA